MFCLLLQKYGFSQICVYMTRRVAISVVTKVKTKEIDIFSGAADFGLVLGSTGRISGSRSELKYPNSGTLSASWLWRVWRAATPSTSWKRVRDFSGKNSEKSIIFILILISWACLISNYWRHFNVVNWLKKVKATYSHPNCKNSKYGFAYRLHPWHKIMHIISA